MTQGDFFENKNNLIISGDEGEAEYIPNFLSKEEHKFPKLRLTLDYPEENRILPHIYQLEFL